METEKLLTQMSIGEMKSALADREWTYSTSIQPTIFYCKVVKGTII